MLGKGGTMEYPIGIEMSKDYLSYEVSKAAYKLVHDVMLVQPGENVVITGDTSTDKRVLEALMSAAYTVGANPLLVFAPTNLSTGGSAWKCSCCFRCLD